MMATELVLILYRTAIRMQMAPSTALNMDGEGHDAMRQDMRCQLPGSVIVGWIEDTNSNSDNYYN